MKTIKDADGIVLLMENLWLRHKAGIPRRESEAYMVELPEPTEEEDVEVRRSQYVNMPVGKRSCLKPGTTMILAIGNAGGNIAETIHREYKAPELKEVRYLFVDCDWSDLRKREIGDGQVILLDSKNDSFPADIFDDVKKLIIVSGLGGETGTKYTELTAGIAKGAGVESVTVIATIPFIFEGDDRLKIAGSAVKRLCNIKGLHLLVLNNEDLIAKYADLNFFNAFKQADKEIGAIACKLV